METDYFHELISEALVFLKQRKVETSNFEVSLLLADILGIEPSEVRRCRTPLSEEQKKLFKEMLEKRAKRWPVDKIIEHKGFYKYEFEVSTDVLSPRADTEILVEKALDYLKMSEAPKILEFGIGSGCVLLSLLADRPDAFGYGIDASEKALTVALKNAKNLGVSSRCRLFCCSWFDEEFLQKNHSLHEMDMIVSNPPYIPTGEIEGLEEEVKKFDPLIALDGGEDGLRDYRQIFKLAAVLLKKEGHILVEIGENQEEDVIRLAKENHMIFVETAKDLAQINRCIIFKK